MRYENRLIIRIVPLSPRHRIRNTVAHPTVATIIKNQGLANVALVKCIDLSYHKEMITNLENTVNCAIEPRDRVSEQGLARRAFSMSDPVKFVSALRCKSDAIIELTRSQYVHAKPSNALHSYPALRRGCGKEADQRWGKGNGREGPHHHSVPHTELIPGSDYADTGRISGQHFPEMKRIEHEGYRISLKHGHRYSPDEINELAIVSQVIIFSR